MTDSFLDLVDQLTQAHPVTVERDSGVTIHTQDGLLQQLREAVFSGMEGGSGSQFGSKPPIDPAAADLLNEIDVQAAEALAKVTNRPTPYGHTEDYVRLWAAQVDEDAVMVVSSKESLDFDPADPKRPRVYVVKHEFTAFQLVGRWVARVKGFFDPQRPVEIQYPCPICGERYVYRRRDGERVRSSALILVVDRDSGDTQEARCENTECGAAWTPDKFEYLKRLLHPVVTQL